MTITKTMIMTSTLTTRTNLDDIKTMIWQYVHKTISSTLISFLSAVLSLPRAPAPQGGGRDDEICDTAHFLLGHLQEVCSSGQQTKTQNKTKTQKKQKHKTKQNKNTRQVYFLPEYIRVLFKSYGRIQNPKNTNTDLVLFNVCSI